jgi:lipopolysaccharide exporter
MSFFGIGIGNFLNKIDSQIAKGAAWMVAFKLIDRSLGLVSTIVLARLLVPADFGLVAMAMVLITALQLLVSFSFDVPLIQNRDAGREQFDTAFTINFLFAAMAAAIVAALAHPAALFYHEPRLETVVYLLAGGFALQGLSNIGPVIFRKQMRFDLEFKFLFGKRLANLLVTLPLAFLLHNYWALVIGQTAGTLISVALSYIVSDYRPRFSLEARVELFHSSKWLMINNVLQFLNGRAADFLIGRFAGAQALGYYSIAYEVSTLPTTELVAPINRAAFPGYAQVASVPAQLRSSFLNVIATIAVFALPAGVGIVVVADLMVPAVLGWKWVAMVPVMQVLAVFGVIQALQTNIGYIYLSTGKPQMLAMIGAVQFVLLLAFLVPGMMYWGVIGAAWAFLISAALMIPINQTLLARYLDLGYLEFGARALRPLLAALAMAGAVLALRAAIELPHTAPAYLAMLLGSVAAGALAYGLALLGLWTGAGRPPGAEAFVFGKVQQVLAKAGIRLRLLG